MKFNVHLFAHLKELAGVSQVSVETSEDATVSDLLEVFFSQYPNIKPLTKNILVSVNQEYADRSRCIYADDEIVLFPPVSGG